MHGDPLGKQLARPGHHHWSAGDIVAPMAGSLLVITAVTGPLSMRSRTAPAGV
jgi:hypothetical protein